MFDRTSRYAEIATYTIVGPGGEPVTVKKIRVIPATPSATSRRIVRPDRPDLLAHELYKAPEESWRIADANRVMDPEELVTEPGKLIRIPARP